MRRILPISSPSTSTIRISQAIQNPALIREMDDLRSVSKGDLEEGTLYQGLIDREKELRWRFIRTVYEILAAQIVLTKIFYSAIVLFSPFNELLWRNSGLLFFFMILPLIFLWPFYIYHQKYPLNLVFLGLLTASVSIVVEIECADTEGRVALEALIITLAVVSAVTCYTFWASRIGKDVSYLEEILNQSLKVLACFFILSLIIPMLFPPLGLALIAINGALGAMVLSGYLVCHTDNLIKHCTYDQYIGASGVLYVFIVCVFLYILRLCNVTDLMNLDVS